MAEIAKMAERIVRKAKEYDRDTIPGDYATLATPCPNCGGVVKENYRRFACTGADGASEGCGFSITKIPAGRAFEIAEAEAFLRERRIGRAHDEERWKCRRGVRGSFRAKECANARKGDIRVREAERNRRTAPA